MIQRWKGVEDDQVLPKEKDRPAQNYEESRKCIVRWNGHVECKEDADRVKGLCKEK